MTTAAQEFEDHAEQMSALADGELDAAALAGLCARWRDDETTRQRWHSYQLIGDVLRSEDLASTAAHDGAFLTALRARLDNEPVVLAPAALASELAGMEPVSASTDSPVNLTRVAAADAGRRRGWGVAAMAAGFAVVVAGALTLNRTPSSTDTVANAPTPSATPGVVVAANDTQAPTVIDGGRGDKLSSEPQAMVANGRLIRDVRLDRYLAAHQQWSGGSVIGGHAAFLRHVAADAPKR